MPGGVADEEDAVLGGRPQLVRDPVALVAHRRKVEIARETPRGLLHVVGGPKGANAHTQLIAGWKAPRVAGAHIAGIDPQLERVPAAVGMDLEASREARLGRLDRLAVGEHSPPAERVNDQRRAQRAAVGLDRAGAASGDGRGLELEPRALRLRPQQRAQLAVVEGRERPRQRPAGCAPRRVHDQLVEGLAMRGLELEHGQPLGGHRARRRLPLADLVAVHDEDLRAAACELARDREPGEARAADENIAIVLQAGALGSPLRGPDRHLSPMIRLR